MALCLCREQFLGLLGDVCLVCKVTHRFECNIYTSLYTLVVLGIEPTVLHTLGKCSTAELHPQTSFCFSDFEVPNILLITPPSRDPGARTTHSACISALEMGTINPMCSSQFPSFLLQPGSLLFSPPMDKEKVGGT